jgi:hypothetical protein
MSLDERRVTMRNVILTTILVVVLGNFMFSFFGYIDLSKKIDYFSNEFDVKVRELGNLFDEDKT